MQENPKRRGECGVPAGAGSYNSGRAPRCFQQQRAPSMRNPEPVNMLQPLRYQACTVGCSQGLGFSGFIGLRVEDLG